MEEQSKNKMLLRRFLEALDRGDRNTVLDSFHTDAVIETMGTMAISGKRTKAQAAASLNALFEMFPEGLNFKFKTFTEEGDRVFCEAESSARHVSGRNYNNHYAFFARVEGGRIIELREYMDTYLVSEILKAEPSNSYHYAGSG